MDNQDMPELIEAKPLPGRVLVVEDDDSQATRIVQLVKGLGHGWVARPVSTAQAALELLESTTFSVALIDLVLPDGTGLDLLREIRRRGYILAAIVMTAHGSEATAIDALRLGAADYIKKDERFSRYLPAAVMRVVSEHRRHLSNVSAFSRLRLQLAQQTHRGLLDSFAAPIVHDIKSPVACISTALDLLGDGTAPPDQLISIMRRSVERVEVLVGRLLKFARQDGEDRSSVDLAKLLGDLADGEVDSLRLQNVRLVRAICPGPVMVRAAPRAIEQVFLNLIANAVEALVMATGGGGISLRLAIEEGSAVVTVTDDGPGIPESVMPTLFQSFASFGKAKGTGLGLSISAGVVREHGGNIQAENPPGGGARFTVALPLEAHGPVALVLEDEAHVRDLVATQLECLGIRADLYDDGDHLLPVLAEGKWDLVILDVRTPRIDGLEVLRRIAAVRPELVGKTMVVSGSIADADLQALLNDHPVLCLPKPYAQDQFNDMVRLLLRNADANDRGSRGVVARTPSEGP